MFDGHVGLVVLESQLASLLQVTQKIQGRFVVVKLRVSHVATEDRHSIGARSGQTSWSRLLQ